MTDPIQPPFRPPWWLRNGHLQTAKAAYFAGGCGSETTVPHPVQLDDGDTIILHDDCPAAWSSCGRAAVLVHGVSGCHASYYLTRIAPKLTQAGVRCFRVDLRGCGAGIELAKQTTHAGRSDDIRAALAFVQQLCPQAIITLVGFSLGGGMVLKMLGEANSAIPANVDGAMAVSPPIDLQMCARNMGRPSRVFYDRQIARWLYRLMDERRERIPAIAQLDGGRRPQSVREFDKRFTAPLGGFFSVDEYYAQSSAGPLLAEIRLPVRILAAVDDPMVPAGIYQTARFSPSTHVWMTQRGGHMGYYAARGTDPDRWWMDWRVVDWVTTVKDKTTIST